MKTTSPAPLILSPLDRWLIPSVRDILFLVFLLSPHLLLDSSVLNDSDTGWHIRNGERILQTAVIPRTDPFSYTHFGQPWFAWEWLADVFMALVHQAAGLYGITTWANVTFALTFMLLFSWILRRGGNLLLATLFTILAGLASAIHWHARPHLFTLLFLFLWYRRLEETQSRCLRGEKFPKSNWCLLPLFLVLWTNLHGGFVVALVLLAIYAFGNFLTAHTSDDLLQQNKARELAGNWSRLTLAGLLATAVNPYGFAVHQHILNTYFHSSFLLDLIQEFLSPNFHVLPMRFFEVILLATLIVFGVSYRRLTYIEIGLVLFWTHMALNSARHIPLYTLVVVPILVRHLSDYCQKAIRENDVGSRIRQWGSSLLHVSDRFKELEFQIPGVLYPAAAVLLLTGISLNQGKFFGHQLQTAFFEPKQFPVKAAEFLEKEPLPGHLFSTDQWGGYLIYRLYPRYQVFFDGRSDMYGEEFLRKYVKIVEANYDWQEILQEFEVDWMLLPAGKGLATVAKESSRWKVIYDDQVAVILVRQTRLQ